MKTTVLILLLAAVDLHAVDFHLYAPSSSARQLVIVNATVQGNDLGLTIAARVPLGFPAMSIVAHPQRPLLYVAGDVGADGVSGAVVTLTADGGYATHTTVVMQQSSCYLSLDRNQRFLLNASYGGQVSVYPLDTNGQPGARVTTRDDGRPEAHAILATPDNRFVYVPYVKGYNALLQFRFDEQTGALSPLVPFNAEPPAGTGPRHLVHHPNLPLLYASNEQHLGVSVYARGPDGQLTLRQLCDAVPPETPKDGVSSSDLVLTPDVRFLFAAIRGHSRAFDWIARYRVQNDGALTLLGLTPTDKVPWSLTLSPDGRFLLVTAFEGATLVAYRIGQEGDLVRAACLAWDKQIMDLVSRP